MTGSRTLMEHLNGYQPHVPPPVADAPGHGEGPCGQEYGYGHLTGPLRQRGLECTVEYGLSDYTVRAVPACPGRADSRRFKPRRATWVPGESCATSRRG